MTDCRCSAPMPAYLSSTVIATDNIGGITVSTVYLADRGWLETCIFDDRNGIASGNPSRVVASYGNCADARAGHDTYRSRTVSVLLALIHGSSK